jgi:hypothetical protein
MVDEETALQTIESLLDPGMGEDKYITYPNTEGLPYTTYYPNHSIVRFLLYP